MPRAKTLNTLLSPIITTLNISSESSAEWIADYLDTLQSNATEDPKLYTAAFICEEMESIIGWANYVIKALQPKPRATHPHA